jgi:urease accessory protein
MAKEVIRIDGIVGNADDPALHEALHRLEHAGRVETITLSSDDMLRRRLRVTTESSWILLSDAAAVL